MGTLASYRCSTRRRKLARMNMWGQRAMEHWQAHLPERFAALDDPATFFTRLGEEAEARYLEVRDGLLAGKNPNDGTIGWAEFQDLVAQADQTARDTVKAEMIYLSPDDEL
jgi:hypothetical protein